MPLRAGADLVDITLPIVIKECPETDISGVLTGGRADGQIDNLGRGQSSTLARQPDQEPVIGAIETIEMPQVVILGSSALGYSIVDAVTEALTWRAAGWLFQLPAAPVSAHLGKPSSVRAAMIVGIVPDARCGTPPYCPIRYLRNRLSSLRGGGLTLISG